MLSTFTAFRVATWQPLHQKVRRTQYRIFRRGERMLDGFRGAPLMAWRV